MDRNQVPPPGGARLIGEWHCTGAPRQRALECRGKPGSGGSNRAIFTSNNEVRLRSSNVHYDTTTLIFGFDVYAKNQLLEPVGTPDGSTVTGVKVFYHSGPTATSYNAPYDTGTITVANADGRQSFTAASQPYHLYDQIIQPQDSTPNKRWELRIPRSVNTFSFVLQVFTRVPSEPPVPSLAPDSVPSWIYSPGNLISNAPQMAGTFPRNIVFVMFDQSATQEERHAAVNVIGGRVVGGLRLTDTYAVHIPDTTAAALFGAIDRAAALPQVRDAYPSVLLSGNHLRPRDALAGWGPTDWTLDIDSAAGDNWGHERIGSPMAWGCSVGDTTVAVGIVDNGFHAVGGINLAAPAYGGFGLWPTEEHGTQVASIVAARASDRSIRGYPPTPCCGT